MQGFIRARERQERQSAYNPADMATVTSSGKEVNALGVGEYRRVPLIAPFGIRWNPPSGSSVQLIKNWQSGNAVVAIGTIVDKEILPGEVEIYSHGGAKIQLKNDGTVIINGRFKINTDGTTERI